MSPNSSFKNALLATIVAGPLLALPALAVDYTWTGATGNWSATTWSPGPITGPIAAGNTAIINSGNVTVNVASLNLDLITIGSGAQLNTSNAYYTGFALDMKGGTFTGSSSWTTYGAGYLKSVTASGTVASTISASSFFNLNGAGLNATTFNVGDVTSSSAVDLSVSSSLRNTGWGGAGDLIKSGDGTLLLSGANQYTGKTIVNAGTLRINAETGLGGTPSSAADVLTLNGGTLQTTATFSIDDTGRGVTLGASGGTFSVDSSTNLTVERVITGAALTKTGAGTLTLRGNNTYTGATNVNEGVLSITLGYLSKWTPINIAAGATLTTSVNNSFGGGTGDQGAAWTIAGTITGTAQAQTMPASVTLNNATMSGNTFASYGTFLSNGSGTTITANGASNLISAGNVGLAQSLTVSTPLATDAVSITGYLGATSASGGGLTKSGSGTLTLSGANIYTGATSVSGGKLVVNASIGVSAVTVSGAGTVLATDAAASFGSTLKIQDGAILAAGDAGVAGTATVTGATTFDNGSIFSWDISADGASYDKLVSAGSLTDGGTAGGSVFRIVAADASFADTFWDSDRTWTNIFTTNGTTAIANWANIFTNLSVVNSGFGTITPVGGSFSISNSTLTWTAVPEPSSALAGLLLGAGLLRRRRKA